MLSVKLINEFLHIPEIFRRFPASPYITVTCSQYKIIGLLLALLSVEDPVEFPFVRVFNDHRLQFGWWLASGRRCIAVEHRDVENIVRPDRIRKV